MAGWQTWRRTGAAWAVGLLLMAGVAGCTRTSPPATEAAPSSPVAATPLPPVGGGSGAATASGTVVPVHKAELSLAAPGWVQTVAVAMGVRVEAGAVLLVLENAAQTADVAQARAGLLRAQANLDEMEAGSRPQEIAAAQARLAAAQALLAQVNAEARPEEIAAAEAELTAAQSEYDALYAAPDTPRAAAAWAKVQQATAALEQLRHPATAGQLAEAEAQVQSAQAELDLLMAGARPEAIAAAAAAVAEAEATLQRAEAALAGTQLLAPFTGTVTSLTVSPGEMVQPGEVVMTLADLDQMQVETTDLSERDVVRVAVGQPVTVWVEALATELSGRVARVAPQASMIGGDVVYTVWVDLDERPANLRWGMSADVEIQADPDAAARVMDRGVAGRGYTPRQSACQDLVS